MGVSAISWRCVKFSVCALTAWDVLSSVCPGVNVLTGTKAMVLQDVNYSETFNVDISYDVDGWPGDLYSPVAVVGVHGVPSNHRVFVSLTM